MADHSRPKRYTNWYLRAWMKAQGVKQADLVRATDLSPTAISLLANDRQDYTPEIVRDLAKALNIAPHELLMHPDDANALKQLRREALRVVESGRSNDRTGTDG